MLTWAGLRGGISIALALTLPDTPWRTEFLVVTYAIVIFTIVVQGLSFARLLRIAYAHREAGLGVPAQQCRLEGACDGLLALSRAHRVADYRDGLAGPRQAF